MPNPSCSNCDASSYIEDARGNGHYWCDHAEREHEEVDEQFVCEDYVPGPGMSVRVEEDCRCAGSSVFNRASCEECHGRGYVVREVMR